jgi:hypothetical protein
MDELWAELNRLKERVAFLELFQLPCYEIILKSLPIDIMAFLKSKQPLGEQVVRFIMNRGIIQVLETKIYICHKHAWISSDLALKEMFLFIEELILAHYKKMLEETDLTAEQFDAYNAVVYSLNIKKNLSKMKQLIIALL